MHPQIYLLFVQHHNSITISHFLTCELGIPEILGFILGCDDGSVEMEGTTETDG